MVIHRLSVVAFVVVAACSGSSEPSASSSFPETPLGAFPADGLSVELRTAPAQPPERGEVQAQLRVTDANGAPRDGLAIDVVPWMPAHGHGSSITPLVTAAGNGTYLVDRLELPMPGTWQLRLTLHAADLEAHATPTLDVR